MSKTIMPSGFSRVSRTTSVLLGTLAALAVLVWLFDWNWVRPPVERYLSKTSQREVRIGDLYVELGFSLKPTVRLRDVYIENAPWADKRPFAEAKEATFTFSLRSVWEGRPIIYRLVLVDAKVDLERQADGLRNWRLRDPEDRGPGRVRLQSLEPHRTTIRFARRDIELDITATASPSPAGTDREADARSHPTSIKFEGELSGKKFSGDLQSSASLTFLDTQRAFALRGVASAGKTRLEVDGTIADLFDPSLIDGHMHLAGPSLAQLHPFLRASLPASRPYEFQSHIRQTQTDTSFAEVRGKIGRSDLGGEFSLVRGQQRPMLRATLHSTSANFADFMPPGDGGLSHKAPHAREARAVGSARREPNAGQPDVSPTTFDGTRLQALDAQVSYEATRFKAPSFPLLENLRVTAALSNGVLELKPIDLRMAGGRIAGALVLDGRQKLPLVHAQLSLKDVELERLLEGIKKQTKGAGPLDGKIDLKGHGDSIAAFLSSASGSMAFAMQSGGISNLLDAKLGLNGGKMLRLLMTGDRAIGINSA
ncbi:MAG: AsmA family protein, partial [Betaproteobacteria bacterium]